VGLRSVVLALMAISALQSYTLGKTSLLWHVIHRDGILFYVYLFCLTIANIVLPQIFPIKILTLASYLQTMYSVLTTRVILNIRDASIHQGICAELHTADSYALSSLCFQSHEHPALSRDSDWTESQGFDTCDIHTARVSDCVAARFGRRNETVTDECC